MFVTIKSAGENFILYREKETFLDDEFDIYIRTSLIFVLSVLFNFLFYLMFLFYIILTLLVYFLVCFCLSLAHQNSTKMEVEKIVQEKTEMQRHYVMVSTDHYK